MFTGLVPMHRTLISNLLAERGRIRGGFRTTGDAVNVARDVASALTYVHQQGYLNLDVKPSNVMYHNGHATLFDFSVAEEYSPDKPLRNDAGTTEYMAPEQTYRREVGYYTDVFGLGVLFYRLLNGGELPYQIIESNLKTRMRMEKPSGNWTTR